MPTWLKVALIVLGVCVVGVVGFFALIFGGLLWFGANANELQKEEASAKAEGRAFGETHDADQCLTAGIKKEHECSGVGLRCQMQNNYRLTDCIQAAHDAEDFCARIPPSSDLTKSMAWALRECTTRDRLGSQPCQRALHSVQEACDTL